MLEVRYQQEEWKFPLMICTSTEKGGFRTGEGAVEMCFIECVGVGVCAPGVWVKSTSIASQQEMSSSTPIVH